MQAIKPPHNQPRPLRVAFLSGLHVGGAERCFLQLAAHFRAAEAVAWIVPNPGATPLKAEAVRLLPVYELEGDERPPQLVERAIAETKADIVVAWGSPNLANLTAGLSIPVVDLCQNSAEWHVMTEAKANAAKGAHYLAAVSRGSATAYPPEFANRAAIIPNAADPNRATPRLTRQEAREAWQIDADENVLLYVARFTTEKNAGVLLDALRHLPDNWRLIACGPASADRAEFMRRAAQYHGGRVAVVETTDIADLLNAADVWALPSHSEGMPLSMLEAMLAGVPCVVSRWDIYQDLEAEHGPMAWPVDRGASGEQFAAAITEASEAGRFDERVARARAVVWNNYTATRVATLWERFLAGCVRDWLALALFPPLSIIEGPQ